MRKVDFPVDKRAWHPSLAPGPIVLIYTYDAERTPNVAPKSRLQMAAFDPPMVMFSGSKGNTTEINTLESCWIRLFILRAGASRESIRLCE